MFQKQPILPNHAPATAPAVRPLTHDERVLEDVRLLILGGVIVADDFDGDDLPIAARIAAANEIAEACPNR